MIDFLKIVWHDIHDEGFTTMEIVKYGIVGPIALVLICGLVEGLLG